MASVISVLFTSFQIIAVILEHYIATCIFSVWQAVVIVKTICFAIFYPLVWVDIVLAITIALLKVAYLVDLRKIELKTAERRQVVSRGDWSFFLRRPTTTTTAAAVTSASAHMEPNPHASSA